MQLQKPCYRRRVWALLQVRGHVEVQIGLIAKGQADKDAVVAHTLQQFHQKFLFFVAKVARMDALFEASFSPLASSGQPLPDTHDLMHPCGSVCLLTNHTGCGSP